MATQANQKPVDSIIIDTGPLIKNSVAISTIINSASVLYTTPAIISEIRDAATRTRVETTLLPFLNIKTPSPASYEAVATFAKKTGDFPVLSKQDLGILALAYEVHCEKHGGPWGLRSVPKGPLNVKSGEEEKEEGNSQLKSEDGEAAAEPPSQQDGEPTPAEGVSQQEAPVDAHSHNAEVTEPIPEPIEDPVREETQPQEHPAEEQASSAPTMEAQEPSTKTEAIEQHFENLQVSTPATQQPTPPTSSEDDDSDGGEWITPSNLAKHKAKDADKTVLSKDEPQLDVATMTTDFAMQNVLLQMNMHLLSTNMQRIRRLRTSILRCHACFLTTKEMDKQFCPRCGQATLKRVSCSTNAKGEFQIHLAKNYQYNNRGNRYSIPKPVGGSSNGKYVGKGGGKGGWGRELVLTEDQKEYQRQVGEGKRSKTRDLMDEDYLPGILTGDRGRAGGRPKVGAGKNINSRKRF